jgi:hypothetical protein
MIAADGFGRKQLRPFSKLLTYDLPEITEENHELSDPGSKYGTS